MKRNFTSFSLTISAWYINRKKQKLIFMFELPKKNLLLKIKNNYLIKIDKTIILGYLKV